MNFKQMYESVQKYIGDESTATLAVIKDVLNQKAIELARAGFLKCMIRETDITTANGTSDYYLPSDVDKIFDIKQTSTPTKLRQISQYDFDAILPNATATGKPTTFALTFDEKVKGQPSAASKIVCYKSGAADITLPAYTVSATIYGVVNGEDRQEWVCLSTNWVVSSVNSYSKIYSITPSPTINANLHFYDVTGSTDILELYANEVSRAYKKLVLYPIPDGAYTVTVKYQALQPIMANDSDEAVLPARYHNAIVEAAVGEMLLKQGDSKATSWYELSNRGKEEMLKDQDLFYDYTPYIRLETAGNIPPVGYPF